MVNLSYLYSSSKHEHIIHKSNFVAKNHLSYSVYRDGIIMTRYKDFDNHDYDGVWSKNRVYDKTSGHNATINDIYNFTRIFPNVKVKQSNDKVIFIGNFSTCWGHFITDSIRHLWFFA